MTQTAEFFDMSKAPMRIGKVRLKVRDLDNVSAFYQSVMSLNEIERTEHRATLGVGRTVLLVLEADPALAPGDRRQAGLFHTAFLMPTRADLAHWAGHIATSRIPLQGASDHIVSEAFYLADPEGNGIEVYVDRPIQRWLDAGGNIQMTTERLDIQDLLSEGKEGGWTGFPDKGSIGHVHLQVGDTSKADNFYRDILGFAVTVDYPGASFYGSGGYHHQLAGNIWNSRGAGQRPQGMAGLDMVEIVMRDPADIAPIVARAEKAGVEVSDKDENVTLRDPWGVAITLKK